MVSGVVYSNKISRVRTGMPMPVAKEIHIKPHAKTGHIMRTEMSRGQALLIITVSSEINTKTPSSNDKAARSY